MLGIKINTQIVLLILLIIILALVFVIINNKYTKDNIEHYKLGKVIENGKRSTVYEIDAINNKKSKQYLYKKIKIIEKTDVETQVKINNNFKYSPKIIDYGRYFYVIEKYDLTLEKLFINNQFDYNKLKKLIKVLREYNTYKYNIEDIHLNNIVWSHKKQIFGIIDWDLIEDDNDNRLDNNLSDIEFIRQFIFKRCVLILDSLKTKYFNLFKNIYNQQISDTDLLNTFMNIENESKIRKNINIT